MEPILTNNIFALHQVALTTPWKITMMFIMFFFEDGAGHILGIPLKTTFLLIYWDKAPLTGKEMIT